MTQSFAELGALSNFSLLEGASHPAELVITAKALGHAGLGICDRNSLAGVVRGHAAAKEEGVPFIVGTRLHLQEGGEYLVWPTDRASYGRLTRLLSLGRMRAPKGECAISAEDFYDHAASCCVAALPGADFAARFRRDRAALGDRLALPLLCATAWHYDGRDEARQAELAEISAGALLLAGHVRYHARERRRLADVLTAIRLGRPVDALGRLAEPNAERCLHPIPELARRFARYPQALAHSLDVLAAGLGFSLAQLRHEYPEEILEPGRTPQQTLEGRVWEAAARRYPAGIPEKVRQALRHELDLVARLGYAPYFLTVDEVVRFATAQGILCQGRGSAANSAICYVLGITAVDPSKHELLFERFLSLDRNEPPDIDVDFEHERREDVIQHIYARYGRERAAIVATVIRYRGRSAIREVGKAMGLSEDITGRLAKLSWGPGRDVAPLDLARSEGLDVSDRRLGLALELAGEIRDFPRHLATHVGGFVMSRGPLTELAVIGNAAMADRTVLEWDKDDIDVLGLVKVDVLGLGMLSCLKRAFVFLEQRHRKKLDLYEVPPDCPQTYAMLRRADSLGVFQVESRAQMNMLPRLKPKQFYDLVIQVAIVRPGPIQGDMVHPYLRRRDGIEEPHYPRPGPEYDQDELKKILLRTLGVPLFQEQAMKLAIVAAGFRPEEADRLRRSMGTFKQTGGVSKYYDPLVGGMVRRGYDKDIAERVFRQIEGFGEYGFPESHAASFAHLVYASAWIKCHYPAVFAAALLNSQPMGFYAPAQIVRDAQDHHVPVRPIDVNASDWDSTLEGGPERPALRLGLRLAAGLSQKDGEAVVGARIAGNGAPFASPEEVARRAGIGRLAMRALAQADAFASMGLARREALWSAAVAEDRLPPLLRLAEAASGLGEPPLLREAPPLLPAEQEGQAVLLDYAATSLSLRRHPLALLRPRLRALGCRDSRDLEGLRSGTSLRLAGLVLMRQRPGTSKGVIFVTVEDEFGSANLVVYAGIAAQYRAALLGARLLLVEGRVEQAEGALATPITHLICRRLEDRSDLLEGLSQEGPARLPPSRDFR